MARQKQPTASPEMEATEQPQYALEPVNEDMRSRLNVWGNSTRLLIEQLRPIAPQWAQFMDDMFTIVGLAMEQGE